MPMTITHGSQYVYAIVLALATLGCTTEIGSFLFMLRLPRCPIQVRSDCRVSLLLLVAVARVIALTFANGNTALRKIIRIL
jgi:hypothetical protein